MLPVVDVLLAPTLRAAIDRCGASPEQPGSSPFCTARLTPAKALLPLVNSLDDGDVAIEGQICEALDGAAWLWPFHFERIQFCAAANSEDDAWIVRRQEASTANLHTAALEVAGLEGEARADGIRV